MAKTIQLSHKGNKVEIFCPSTRQKINITIAQAQTLYEALRIIVKKEKAA